MKAFKPMKAPNQTVDIKTVKYPLLASYKIDGIRCLFKDGKMYTSALKQFANIQLWNRFKDLAKITTKKDAIFDGELFTHDITFNELSGVCRQLDKELPTNLDFYCFDAIHNKEFIQSFQTRITLLSATGIDYLPHIQIVEQWSVFSPDEVNNLYKNALAWGCDGLILRDPNGKYKCGRGTIKEGLIYKMKPFETFDSKIIGLIQSTEVRKDAEKTINELGRSVTSKKKDDRILIKKAAAFVVLYKGKELKVTIAMTDEEKKDVWINKQNYVGRWIEYKGMLVGSKDLPRHPTFIRFRDDKKE